MKSHLFCVALIAGGTLLAAAESTTAVATDATSKPSNNTPQISLTRVPDVVDPLGAPASTATDNATTSEAEASDATKLPLPALRVDGNLPDMKLDSSAAPIVDEPAPQAKPKSGGKLWVTSMFAFGGGTTLDGLSSWHQKEANPLLSSADGTFEMKGVLIKAALAGMVLVPQLVHKPQNETTRKIMTIVNFSDGAAYSAVGIHNYVIR
jgi:hypothetical protein